MKRPVDTQQTKLYKWEREMWAQQPPSFRDKLTLEECKQLAVSMAGTPRVKVGAGRGCVRALAYHRQCRIELPLWARWPGVIAHECAHLHVNSEDYPAHGATFTRVYLKLLAQHHGVDEQYWAEHARAAGVQVADKLSKDVMKRLRFD